MNEWPWQLAILLSKLVVYSSFVSLAGGLFVLCLGAGPCAARAPGSPPHILWSVQARRRITGVMLLASIAGTLAICLFFLLQVGLVNQNGLAGMADFFMIKLLAQTPIGTGVFLRLAGFLMLGVLLVLYRKPLLAESTPELPASLLGVGALAIVFCCSGFAVLGHVADLNPIAQVLLGGHVLAAGLWIGSLFPLYTLCRTERASEIYPLMKRFGDWGWSITLSLLVAGVYLLFQLLVSPGELFTTRYGQLLTFKITLLLCLLGLAALNRFRLVPALEAAGTGRLQRSIQGEMALAGLILLMTAVLSTVTGPAHLMG